MVQPVGIEPTSMSLQDTAITISAKVANLVEVDGNAPRALTSLPLGTVLQTAVVGNFRLYNCLLADVLATILYSVINLLILLLHVWRND